MARRRKLRAFEDLLATRPGALRDGLRGFSDLWHVVSGSGRVFAPVVDTASRRSGNASVVGVGGGSGFFRLARFLRVRSPGLQFERTSETRPTLSPLQAPELSELRGTRVYVSTFHRLDPEQAQAALREAFDRRESICVLELTRNSPLALATTLGVPLLMCLLAPFIRPFRLSRIALTYLIPILPLAAMWDTLVAHIRTYSRAEYMEMTAPLSASDYEWRLESVRVRGLPYRVDCLVGAPVAPAFERAV